MAFPQDAVLNERWSEDQSAVTPDRPSGRIGPFLRLESGACAVIPCLRGSGKQAAYDAEITRPSCEEN